MRKTHWVSLGIAFFIASLISFGEFERRQAFMDPAAEPSAANRVAMYTQMAEWFTYDLRSRFESRRAPHPDIVVITIDDQSLRELHQWPWPRSVHAKLIRQLAKAPPKALAFDIFFVDPFTKDPAGDRELVAVTRQNPWVIHSIYAETNGHRLTNVNWPFPSLRSASKHIGFVNAFVDEDGVLRTALPSARLEGKNEYLLSVLAAGLYLSKSPEDLLRPIPRDARGQFLVHFIGSKEHFSEVAYQDVLAADAADIQATFKGKIVLVGSIATGTYDHYPMPNSKNSPGVYFHANIIDNLLRLNALNYSGIKWTFAIIFLLALLCGLMLSRLSVWAGTAAAVGLGAGLWAAGQWLFTARDVMIDVAGPILTIAFAYVGILMYRFFTEEREKRMVKAFFSQQVSGDLLDLLMQDPEILKRAGERREMTAFFSDVAGFTSISERLEPEALVELLNRYLTAMTDVIFEYGGYLDKYMGDGIMAFWNGLLPQRDHAERACRCALKSRDELTRLNAELAKKNLAPLKARIGVNTGPMAAGYMGSSQKKQYTIMGDNVNLASRLEGANKAFGTAVMISEFTYEHVQDKFEVRFLDRILVPGKAKPVKVYELLAEKGQLPSPWPKALPLYHAAIDLFAQRHFAEARQKFLEVASILGQDKASLAYVARADAFIAHPPAEDWDGVFEVKSK